MRKISKTLVALLATLNALCCAFGLIACGDSEDPTPTPTPTPDAAIYTFTVVDENGNGVEGIDVQLCELGENGICFMPKTTDANGVAKFESEDVTAAGVYAIHLIQEDGFVLINGAKSAYTFDNDAQKTKAVAGEYTLTLVKSAE